MKRGLGIFPRITGGVCLSFIDDNERVMNTNPGANLKMHEHIDKNFESIAQYLSSARYVHVTSFFDDKTPAKVLAVLQRAKTLNPEMKISFDPGFDWANHQSTKIRGILGLADLLFVNYREFKGLGRYLVGEPDDKIARKVLARCSSGCTVFVTKRYDYTEVFRNEDKELVCYRFQLLRALRETVIEDATGAGEVFAASVLSAVASNRLKVELGGYLGLTLAQHKLPVSNPYAGWLAEFEQWFPSTG